MKLWKNYKFNRLQSNCLWDSLWCIQLCVSLITDFSRPSRYILPWIRSAKISFTIRRNPRTNHLITQTISKYKTWYNNSFRIGDSNYMGIWTSNLRTALEMIYLFESGSRCICEHVKFFPGLIRRLHYPLGFTGLLHLPPLLSLLLALPSFSTQAGASHTSPPSISPMD